MAMDPMHAETTIEALRELAPILVRAAQQTAPQIAAEYLSELQKRHDQPGQDLASAGFHALELQLLWFGALGDRRAE